MSKLAAWIADYVWYGCLWVMRRPLVHAVQERTIRRFPRAWENHLKQNRFALAYGRRLLRFLFSLLLAYFVVLFLYVFLTEAMAKGWLTLPQSIQDRVNK